MKGKGLGRVVSERIGLSEHIDLKERQNRLWKLKSEVR